MQKSLPLLTVILVICAIIAGGIWWYVENNSTTAPSTLSRQGASTAMAATLAFQQGEVQVKIADGDWQTVETDTVLHQGDSVKTGENSKAIVELEDGSVVRLGYNTEIFLTSLKQGAVTVSQTSGASYNRVAKNARRVYEVVAEGVTVQAQGTAFDVVETEESVDVNVVESTVKVITEEEQEQVAEGESASVDKEDETVDVSEMDKEELKNDWYTWNKEEDSKTTDKLGVLSKYAGPTLTITSPADGAKVEAPAITVTGTVNDFAATLTVNGEEVANNAGQFSQTLNLHAGKNVITVVAEDAEGNKTIQEVRVMYQVPAAATPLKLEAETGENGVHLSWNESTNATFQFYKLVRSETNADLKYPNDGYLAKLDKGTEEYTDTATVVDKTYYYRVCEVLTGEQVFCSNVVHMQGQKAESEETNSNTNTEQEEGSSIKLEAEAENDGIHLAWEVKNLTIEHGFKIVKGPNANPVYPGNEYQYLSDSAVRSYVWPLTDGVQYHFRVCQYNGDGGCLVYSNNVTVTAKHVAPQYTGPVMSVKAEDNGVGIWWTDKSDLPGFQYYKVVRSETNANLKYPDDGYIAVKGEGEESHRDYSAVKGKSYYYRICAVGNQVYCSNVSRVTATNENEAPAAVELEAEFEDGQLTLSWGESDERDFVFYKVAWSQTDVTPAYPANGYIAAISEKATNTFTDTGAKVGTREAAVDLRTGAHYYSVCVLDSAGQVTCSNVVTVVNGVVQ